MMKYERFTQWTESGASLILENPQNAEEARTQLMEKFKLACNKLAELEDDLESGKIIRLPCKVGDTIYYINRNNNVVEEDVVKFFTFTKDGIKPILTKHNKKFWEFYEWDKTVFLTREEAEAKLKELQNG